ncbi:gamma-glutamyltransferase [Glaciecola sp. 1036]|uniref:gamma-glutamyltransferase n=1 Tax=Alteromonadaceae TaxID=72275 RepID=UPI003CFF6D21
MKLLYVALCALSLNVMAQQQPREDREPEAATGLSQNKAFTSKEYMVVAANPYASWAGKRIIEQGGSAIDAAIAVQAMLTLVEPQSSGIGGGAFILYWDNKEKRLYTYDGREIAPINSDPFKFIVDGKPMSWRDAVVGGNSVGVPGVLRALEMAHTDHGKLEWEKLFSDSIDQAANGFEVSPRLAKLLSLDLHPGLNSFAESYNYFKPQGQPIKAGTLLKNNALSETLQHIADEGADYFYTGELAEKIAETVRLSPINPGKMSTADLRDYEAIKRSPMCGVYRKFRVCGMAPPSSGGVSVQQILKGLEQFDLSTVSPSSAEFVHLFSQSSALAFADREAYIADLDFLGLSAVPLVNPGYMKERASLISLEGNWTKASAGKPYNNLLVRNGPDYNLPSTSHLSIVDKEGNAISMTTSIEFMFGSGLMVDGFLLNNQLTDFALDPGSDGEMVLNKVEPKKRPRSSMSPTMVFDENNNLKLVVGSPGGSRIINYVAQTLLYVLDYDMNVQEAISAPRITNRNDYTALEKGRSIENLKASLEAKGHDVRIIDLNSGLHGIQLENGTLIGGADPRREGIAVGQ